MSRIRVALFESQNHAEHIQQRLALVEIPAEVHSELGLAKLWYVSRQCASVRLDVRTEDAERARRLLLKWDDEDGSLLGAVRCPECGSLRVDYPQFTPKSIFPNLALGLVAGLGLIEREYYCEDCHWMWAKPGTKRPRFRLHMAPDYFLDETMDKPRPGPGFIVERPVGSTARRSWPLRKCSSSRRQARCAGLNRWRTFGCLLVIYAPIAAGAQTPRTSPPPTVAGAEQTTYMRDVLPIFMGKCARCHNEQTILENWLDYRRATARRWEIKRRVWDSWKGGYFKQPMPAANSPESEAMTDEERTIIRNWVKSGAPRGTPPAFNSAQSKTDRIELGKRLFATICAACHQPTGQGIPARFPPLANSDFLNADKHRAIKIVANGVQGEITVNGQRFNNSMPKLPLSDEEIASALTYVYNSFGNSGRDVVPGEVHAARGEKDELNLAGRSPGARPPEEPSPYE